MNIDNNNQENRIDSLDIFKGVLIFLVVLGHFLLPIKDGEYMFITKIFFFIYSFHMPAFIFVSGYVYYDSWKRKGTGFKSIWSLILLFFFMKILLHISDMLFYGDKSIIPDFFHESSTPWYVSTLIIFRLTLFPLEIFLRNSNTEEENIENKFIDSTMIYITVLLLITLFISMLNGRWQMRVEDFLSLDRVVSFAPFFYIGLLYKKYSSVTNTSIFEKTNIFLFVLGFLCIGSIFVLFQYTRFYTLTFYGPWGYRIAENNILPIFKGVLNPLRIIFILYALSIAYFVFVICCKKKFLFDSLLKKFGVYTLPIFVFHRPIRDAFTYCVVNNISLAEFGSISMMAIMLVLSFLTCFLFGNDSANRICRFEFKNNKISRMTMK